MCASVVAHCDAVPILEASEHAFDTIEEMQGVLDDYLVIYNTRRLHQGRGMNGRTPAQAFMEGLPNASQQQVTARPQQTKIKTA